MTDVNLYSLRSKYRNSCRSCDVYMVYICPLFNHGFHFFANHNIMYNFRSLHVPPFCFMFNSRKTRSIAWESAQLSTWLKFMAYDWLSLNRLGNTGSRGRLPLLPLDPLLSSVNPDKVTTCLQ